MSRLNICKVPRNTRVIQAHVAAPCLRRRLPPTVAQTNRAPHDRSNTVLARYWPNCRACRTVLNVLATTIPSRRDRVNRAGQERDGTRKLCGTWSCKAKSSIRDAGFTTQRPTRDRKPDERLWGGTCRPYGTWSCKANSSIRDAGFTLQCPARDRKPDERLWGRTCRPYGTWSCKANSSIRDAGFTLQRPARDRKPHELLGEGTCRPYGTWSRKAKRISVRKG
jgi:hypothetical protein